MGDEPPIQPLTYCGTVRSDQRLTTTARRPALRETHLQIRSFLQVDAFHEAYLAGAQRHDYGRGSGAFAEEAYALHQRAIGDAGSSEDQLLSWRQVFRLVDAALVFDAHARQAFFLVRFYHEASQHVPIEAADGSG